MNKFTKFIKNTVAPVVLPIVVAVTMSSCEKGQEGSVDTPVMQKTAEMMKKSVEDKTKARYENLADTAILRGQTRQEFRSIFASEYENDLKTVVKNSENGGGVVYPESLNLYFQSTASGLEQCFEASSRSFGTGQGYDGVKSACDFCVEEVLNTKLPQDVGRLYTK